VVLVWEGSGDYHEFVLNVESAAFNHLIHAT